MPTPKTNKEFERRFITAEEFRFDEDGNTISGYAARFNVWSEDLGYFREKIKKGAFAKTIKEHDVRALFNHDPNLILARTPNGTLLLEEDNKGLHYEAKLPDTTYARDLKESIKRGDITQNSFGFQTVQDKWEMKEGKDLDERTLVEVKLFDISPVTFAAYPQTDVKVRTLLYDIGIDYDALGLVITRAERGMDITESDKEILHTAMSVLGTYLSNEKPLAEEHLETVNEPRLLLTRCKRIREETEVFIGIGFQDGQNKKDAGGTAETS